jgi:NADPH:quinone reductase-like Zn-dependent oxidoreductase
MKAVVLVAPGEIKLLSDVPVPSVREGEALIRIEASALNRRDYWITQGLYPNIVVCFFFLTFRWV